MSSYVVLARKWRPAQFADIVGQSHIVRTLTNAIRLERIHHAYLFTGSRGIGKTSIARIFAKVLRCEKAQEVNGFIQSCDQCSSCKEIAASNSVDVIEIDGASNNGVEAVREIRDNACYMPSTGARKIYIIDEVHMLTTAAFNALLKTLEEPPSHVIFIFATTEPHKIPATILSRCQKFDYRRVTAPQIKGRLNQILESETIPAEQGVLSLIARAAEGSMRDALSLLDQVIAFSGALAGNTITLASVRDGIGLIEGSTLTRILSGVFNREPLKALAAVEEAYQQGHELRVLTRHLIEYLHATLLAKVGTPHSSVLEIPEEEWSEIQSLSKTRTLEEMELFFQVLHQGLEWIARSPQPKQVLDVLLIKCSTAEALIYFDPNPNPSPKTHLKSPSAAPPQGNLSPLTTPVVNPAPQPNSAQRVAAVVSLLENKAPLAVEQLNAIENKKTPELATPSSQAAVSTSEISKSPRPQSFSDFIDFVRQTRPLLASILEHCSGAQIPCLDPAAFNRNFTLYFSAQDAYFREQLYSKAYQEQFAYLSKEYFGTTIRLQVELKELGESLASKRQREQKEHLDSIKEKAQNHPIILEAKSLFGGQLGPIDIREVTQNASPTT